MLNKTIAAALLATTMIAAPAFAQTGTSSQNTGTSSSTMNTTVPSAGMPAGNFLSNDQTSGSMWRVSKLKGVNIYGPNDEKVGDVNEILIDSQGNAKAVVIGVGGFLGMGEKDVAMPFNSIQWVNESRNMASTASAPATTAPAPNATVNRTDTTGTTVGRADMNRTYPDHGKISMTKDQLKSAPSFRLER